MNHFRAFDIQKISVTTKGGIINDTFFSFDLHHIMYINGMKQVLKACEINLLADDTVLFISHKEIKQAEFLINID